MWLLIIANLEAGGFTPHFQSLLGHSQAEKYILLRISLDKMMPEEYAFLPPKSFRSHPGAFHETTPPHPPKPEPRFTITH